jgi:hypothetical protein
MRSEAEDIVAVRREILDLLRQQMAALDSPLGVTDDALRECYDRQARVQELGEKLQASAQPQNVETDSTLARAALAPLESAASL